MSPPKNTQYETNNKVESHMVCNSKDFSDQMKIFLIIK